MTEQKYKHTLDSSFENAYHDCKLVDDSITDEKSYQECDTGLVLANMDRILEALEKQIPKKIELTKARKKCSNCNYIITNKGCTKLNVKYCYNCGQKLSWDETE